MKTALFVRLDKIGDLVLTLPSDQQPSVKDYNCFWIVAPNMGFIPKYAVPARNYFELSQQWSWKNFRSLWSILKQTQPELTVSFQSPWWIPFTFFLFGVKKRVGVLSKWHSFLFLNQGLRQKRSRSEFNELEYNHQLVHTALQDHEPITYPTLTLQAPNTTIPMELPNLFVVVHPGMAGSARNWPAEKYVELIQQLSELQIPTIITGTAADAPYIQPLQEPLKNTPHILWWNEKLNLQQLLYVLSRAHHVVAPSTGVLHLAASLGTPVTGIYSPVRVQHPKRWGPKGKNITVLYPSQVNCPGAFSCLYEKCSSFDCMTLVSSREIVQTIKQ